MQPHEQRVIDERNDLREKISRLSAFSTTSDIYKTLSKEEKGLLVRQYKAMVEYDNVLSDRIVRFRMDDEHLDDAQGGDEVAENTAPTQELKPVRWEYYSLSFNESVLVGIEEIDLLDDCGGEGWELVTVTTNTLGNTFWFKRPVYGD